MGRSSIEKLASLSSVLVAATLFAGPPNGAEVYQSTWLQGRAAIQIDGDLNDWTAIATTPVPLTRFDYTVGGAPPSGDADLSATFRCIADFDHVYIAVRVKDDALVFRDQLFNNALHNDAVQIELYGGTSLRHLVDRSFRGNDGQIVVSADASGQTILEGVTPAHSRKASLVSLGLPSLWSALGVQAALKPIEGGYAVELAIPFELLEWQRGVKPLDLGLNIRVFDNDSGKPAKSVLSWSVDPHNLASASHEFYGTVRFINTQNSNPDSDVKSSNAAPEALYTALKKLAEFDPEGAVTTLAALADDSQIWPLLAEAQIASGRLDEAVATLRRIISTSPNVAVNVWATLELSSSYERKGDHASAVSICKQLASSPGWSFELRQEALLSCVALSGHDIASNTLSSTLDSPGRSPEYVLRSAKSSVDSGERDRALSLYTQLADASDTSPRLRTTVLLQKQRIETEQGSLESSIQTALRMQREAPDGDPNRQASYGRLVRVFLKAHPRATGGPSLSSLYREAVSKRAVPVLAKQLLELGELLTSEGEIQAALGAYHDIGDLPSASRSDRAHALLRVQEIEAGAGDMDGASSIGAALQSDYTEELDTRLASLIVLRKSAAGKPSPAAATTTYSNMVRRYLTDLNRSVSSEDQGEAVHARSLLEIAGSQLNPRQK